MRQFVGNNVGGAVLRVSLTDLVHGWASFLMAPVCCLVRPWQARLRHRFARISPTVPSALAVLKNSDGARMRC